MAGANLFKATWFIKYGRGGFSFSHWMEENGHQQVLTKAAKLRDAYMMCMGQGVLCDYIRVSQEGILGDSLPDTDEVATFTPGLDALPGGGKVLKGIVQDTPDVWWTSALLRLGSTPLVWGHQFMRGIADEGATSPRRSVQSNALIQAIDAYFDELVAGQWGMYALARSATSQKKILGAVSIAGNTAIQFQTDGAHNFVDGEEIRISRFGPQLASKPPNGKWVVSSNVDATHFNVLTASGMSLPGLWKRGGYAWTLKKAFALYSRAQFRVVRITRRKAGRPFGSLVGHQKKKA